MNSYDFWGRVGAAVIGLGLYQIVMALTKTPMAVTSGAATVAIGIILVFVMAVLEARNE